MFLNYLTLLQEIRWDDLLDIGFATIFIALGIHVLRSSRTRAVSLGLLFFGGVFFIANQLDLKLTIWMLQGTAAVIVLLVIIVYQTEIRRFLEQLPNRVLLHKIQKSELHTGVSVLISEAIGQLTSAGQGALIILPGRDSLEGLLTGGIPLDGHLSKALILSIFDPNSPGHDGAVIIHGDRIDRFGARLPLSDQIDQLRDRGTRHAAALGLSEKTDALVLVVSEERAQVSVAQNGHLQVLHSLEKLNGIIDQFLIDITGSSKKINPFVKFSGGYGVDSLFALVTAVILWLILVPGTVVEELAYEVPVEVQNIPEGFMLSDVSPAVVSVSLSGERRNLFLLNTHKLEIRLDATLTRFGRKTFPITNAHLLLPPEINIARIIPEEVRVLVKKSE